MLSAHLALTRYPRHIRYPSDIVAHLDGSMRMILLSYGQEPFKLRAAEIKQWFREEHAVQLTTASGEPLSVSRGYLTYENGRRLDCVLVTHKSKQYFFSVATLDQMAPLELLFGDLKVLGAEAAVDTEMGIGLMAMSGIYYNLVEAGTEHENPSYARVLNPEAVGANNLAEIIANSYRFEFSREQKAWVPITNPQHVLMNLRMPYYAILSDAIMPLEEQVVLGSAGSQPNIDSYTAGRKQCLAELGAAFATPFDIGPKGQAIMQDPLFSFAVK